MDNLIQVLVVEDNELAQMVVKALLEKCKCYADIASTGDECFTKVEKKKYDLILMDIGLGDTDGFTVTSAIKKNFALNQSTPVIALTAHEGHEYRQKAKEVGMVNYVTKPLILQQIKELLELYVEKENGYA